MSNALFKSILSTYIPGSPGVSGSPGQPYQPAGYYWETQYVCTWKATTTYTGNDTGLIFTTNYVQVCANQQVQVYREAQPYLPPTPSTDPVPAQFISDYQLGWNAGARSISLLNGDGYAAFTVPHSNSGSFVGLNDADLNAGYIELNYAIYAHRGIAEVYEGGVFKHYIGAYAEGAVFKIRRRRGVVTYLVDDVVAYTSLTPNTGTLFLDVSIYTGGDYISDPQLVEEFSGDATLSFPAGQVFAVGRDSLEPAYASANATLSFEPMTVAGRSGARVAMSFEPMQLLAADRPYGAASLTMLAPTITAEAGMIKPSYALGAAVMVPPGLYATGLTGEVGSAAMSLQPMTMLAADRPYGEAHISMAPPAVYGYNTLADDEVVVFSGAQGASTLIAPLSLYVVMDSSAAVVEVFAMDIVADASMNTSVEAATTHALEALLGASMYARVSGSSTGPLEDQNPQVWVVNTENLASTRYEAYPYNSFAKIGGVYYGARADGIYQLDGDDDNGLPVRAMVDFGLQAFGTSAGKRVENAYLGVSSSGRMFMRVSVEGRQYTYAARNTSDVLEAQRVDFGRGVEGTYLGFELYNEEGADFELATVEFVAIPLKRRI